MKISLVVSVLCALCASAKLFGSDRIYDKWHETTLETWLGDHDIPYPAASDRKAMQALVQKNWNKVTEPYSDWDTDKLAAYLNSKGVEVDAKARTNKDSLLNKVKSNWYDNEAAAEEGYASVRDWIFDTWSESNLKAFLDKNGIPTPNPRTRDSLLSTARDNYNTVANKMGDAAAYPGSWVFDEWSDSDLKAWLDARGYPVPQGSTRNKLVAAVRRNSRWASLNAQDAVTIATQKAKTAGQQAYSAASSVASEVSDSFFDTWSESDLKKWCDERKIPVPQGSKKNELIALARRNKHKLAGGDDVQSAKNSAKSSASSAFGAATSNAGNQFARATDLAAEYGEDAFNAAIGAWSDTRLKGYLDARGVPNPQGTTHDQLLAQVRLQRHKAASGWSAWTFDTWTTDNLRKFLVEQGDKAANKASVSRDELVKSAQSSYSKASASGPTYLASVTSYLSKQTDAAKAQTFDSWSESDIRAYLNTYGVKNYQGSTRNELVAAAQRNANLFTHGAQSNGIYDQVRGGAEYLVGMLQAGLGRLSGLGEKAGDASKEKATQAKDRAYEAGQTAYDRAKEEL